MRIVTEKQIRKNVEKREKVGYCMSLRLQKQIVEHDW